MGSHRSRIVLTLLAVENVDQKRPHDRRSPALPRCSEDRLQRLRRVPYPLRVGSHADLRPGSPQPRGSEIEMLTLRQEGREGDRAVAALVLLRVEAKDSYSPNGFR